MTQSLSTIELNQILTQDVDSVLNWLKNLASGKSTAPRGFNWHGLAEAAAFNAREGSPQEATKLNLKWAEVSVTAYEGLAAKTNPSMADSLMFSSMMLRANMISKLGAVPGHPVLDVDVIINWFEKNLTMSQDEVSKKAQNWQQCQIEEIRELRKIKNYLQVISVLAKSDKVVLNPEIYSWLALREQLP